MATTDINKREFTVEGELNSDGSIKLAHYRSLRRILRKLEGARLEVTFRKLRFKRSDAQNRYLWGVAYVTICAWHKEQFGEVVTKEEIHAHTLKNILKYKIKFKEVMGSEVMYVDGKSTSKLNTKEFVEFIDNLQAFYAERGCVIPDPR